MATAKKIHDVEYRLTISPHHNERLQKRTAVISIETTKVFASFRYELSVSEQHEGKTLRYRILGLKAPRLDLPSAGSARFAREYENLTGRYHLEVKSLDGTLNTCDVNFTKNAITLLKPLKSSFIEFAVL